jgi:hypothetical protein
MGGSGGRVAVALPCPGCGRKVTVLHRPSSSGGWAGRRRLWFTCTSCDAVSIPIEARIPGLPSDTSFLEDNWQRLAGRALAKERRKQERERAARRRAEELLKRYLNGYQRRTYDARRVIRVSSRSVRGLRYEIDETRLGAHVTALLAPRIRAAFRPPGLTESAIGTRRGGLSAARIPLCLHPTGSLPPPDQVLALKLFLEADEASAWKKGTRMLRGFPAERML